MLLEEWNVHGRDYFLNVFIKFYFLQMVSEIVIARCILKTLIYTLFGSLYSACFNIWIDRRFIVLWLGTLPLGVSLEILDSRCFSSVQHQTCRVQRQWHRYNIRRVYVTFYTPILPLFSHSLVFSKNHLYIIGIGQIRDKNL